MCIRDSSAAAFSCYAIDNPAGGADVSVVSAEGPFGNATLNFRDTRWIANSNPFDAATVANVNVRRTPTTAIIRQNNERFDVPCTDDIYGDFTLGFDPDLATMVGVSLAFDNQVVWFFEQTPLPGFRSSRTNFITQLGELPRELEGGDQWAISSPVVHCDGRIVTFDAVLTDDPGVAYGVLDPVADLIWTSQAAPPDGTLSVNCNAERVTVQDAGRTETYSWAN